MEQVYRQQILEVLQAEEDKISKTLLPNGASMMEICRAIDWYCFQAKHHATKTLHPLFSELGINKAIALTLNDASRYRMIGFYPTNPKIETWADSFLLICDKIASVEYFLELNRVGLASIQTREDGYIFVINAENSGYEGFERNHFSWAITQAQQDQKRFIGQSRKERLNILKEMKPLVSHAKKDYMTYDTNPDIDDYFMRLGKTEARKMLGADAFPPYAMFGGIEYSLYCRAVETMVGWSIKHVMFANLLLEKRGYLKPRNLLTLLNPKEKIVAYLESALRVEQKTCHQIIDAVTLSLENAQEQFNGASRFVMPAYIAVNSVQMMCPIWGTHFNPYMFLLAELKRRHQKEWFDNVNLREEQFRRELYLLFPNDRFVTVDRNISIKEGKREITDIDAVIYDKQEKVLGIFQLKFQDLFGKSLRQRSNRKQGMLKANKWVINTLAWIEAHSIPELQEKLGFKGKDTEIEKIYLFVVGRYAAHFSGKETPDDKAAWGTWYQIQRIMSRFENHSVGLLHSILVQESPRVNEIELPNDLVIQIGTTSFFITHHRENDAG